MRRFNRIFGVGISRTGTKSLSVALEHLGIPTIHWPTNMLDLCRFRGATDITVACRFRELDQLFPDSLFVYSERSLKSWLVSIENHYAWRDPAAQLPPGARQFAQEAEVRIYGRIWPKGSNFAISYQKQREDVLNYFSRRKDSLLQFDVSRSDNWSSLCDFLDVKIPQVGFPHENQTDPRSLGLTVSDQRRKAPPDPTFLDLTNNFADAIKEWVNSGAKVVNRDVYEYRHAICEGCEHWQSNARLGTGKCKICGCSGIKLWLASSKCPHKPPKW